MPNAPSFQKSHYLRSVRERGPVRTDAVTGQYEKPERRGKQNATVLPGLALVTPALQAHARTNIHTDTYGQINIQMLERRTVTDCWSTAAEDENRKQTRLIAQQTAAFQYNSKCSQVMYILI